MKKVLVLRTFDHLVIRFAAAASCQGKPQKKNPNLATPRKQIYFKEKKLPKISFLPPKNQNPNAMAQINSQNSQNSENPMLNNIKHLKLN